MLNKYYKAKLGKEAKSLIRKHKMMKRGNEKNISLLKLTSSTYRSILEEDESASSAKNCKYFH